MGYHDQFYEQTKTFPYSIYAKITPVFHSPEENAKSRLEALGYRAEDVSIVVISHFHADHIAGLVDFPNANFFVILRHGFQSGQKADFGLLKEDLYLPCCLLISRKGLN